MVQRRNLNKPPARQLADVVAGIREKQDQQRTGSHGVKDMGNGNIVWTRPEAPEVEVSIRDIDGDLQAAQGRIDEAKADSAEALDRATDAKTEVDAARDRLDDVETVTIPGVEQAIRDAQDELESDIDTVRTSVDGKNAITQSVDAPPAQYAGAVGDRWERMSSMGPGGSLVSNWRWNGTVWVSTIISDAVLGNVDAAKIGTGYLNANRIEAGTVSADKLLIGAGGNLIAWGQVTSGITTEPHFKWGNSSNLSLALAPVDSGRGVPPHMVVSRYSTGSESYVAVLMASSGRKAPGVVGESYTFSVSLYSDTPGAKASVQLATYTSDGTSTDGHIAHIAIGPVVDLSPEPRTLTISGTAPEGTQFLAPLIRASGPADIGVVSPSLRPQVGATLIEDGAIATPKLTVTEDMSANIVDAMSLESKKLVVTDEAILNHATLIGDTVVEDINVTGKLIGTDGVFTGTVDFENVNVTSQAIVNALAANAISSEKIDVTDLAADMVSAGLIRTGTSGRRTEIKPAGIAAYNSSGQQTVSINGNENFLSGTISTGRAGMPAAILTPVLRGGGQVGGGVWFSTDGSLGQDQAAIYSLLDGNIHIRPKDTTPKGTVFIDGNLNVDSRTWFQNQVDVGGLKSNGNVVVGGPSAQRSVLIHGDIRATHPGSDSSSANAVYMSNGQLVIQKSSRRYKKNIADWNPEAERVLALQPRQWQHSDPTQPGQLSNLSELWHVGFIAEEVDELGLNLLVKYEGDGKGGWRPESLNYDRFAAAHQIVLQKHEDEIKELRERIALLESK